MSTANLAQYYRRRTSKRDPLYPKSTYYRDQEHRGEIMSTSPVKTVQHVLIVAAGSIELTDEEYAEIAKTPLYAPAVPQSWAQNPSREPSS